MTAAPLDDERLAAWRAAQPGRRPDQLAAVLAWVLLVVVATVVSPEGGCTVAEPCRPEWLSSVEVGAALAAPLVLLLAPAPGAVVSYAAAGLFVLAELVLGDVPLPLALLLAGVVLLATSSADDRRRRRERRWRDLAAGLPRGRWDGPVPAAPRLPAGVVVGLVLLLCAAAALALGLQRGQAERAAEARASRATGTVVAHADDGYVVTLLVEDRRVEVDTWLAADRPVGSEQQLLLLPDGQVRLVAEPYDPSGWGLLATLLGLTGAALALRSRERAHRLRSLLEQDQPLLRVRVAPTAPAAVLRHDDVAAAGPPLALAPLALVELDEDEDDDPSAGSWPAVLHGLPRHGHPVAARLDDGRHLVPLGPARRAPQDWSLPFATALPDHDLAPVVPAADDLPPDQGGRPAPVPWPERRWRAPLGAAVLLAGLVALAAVLALTADPLDALWRGVLAAQLALQGALLRSTGAELRPDALVHRGLRHRLVLPWRGLSGVDVVDDALLARTREDDVHALPWVPVHGLTRSQRRRSRLAVAAGLQARVVAARTAVGFVHPVDWRPRTEPVDGARGLVVGLALALGAGLLLRGAS